MNFPNRVVWEKCTEMFFNDVLLFFNQSLQCGQLPYIWKRPHVTPVYKNIGTASDITNFRPIALTCVLCKMMETIIVKHLHNYVL
jgi:hypothetical protein